MDRLSGQQRSRLMARITGDRLRPEATVKRRARALRLQFVPNDRRLPGTPDLTFWGARVAVMVNGCFWHGHRTCYRRPRTRTRFWDAKLTANRARDRRAAAALRRMGWAVTVIWECEIKRTGG